MNMFGIGWFREKLGWNQQQQQAMQPQNALADKPLRYLIGTDTPGTGRADEITEVGYDVTKPPPLGVAVKYCNLFDEKNTGRYGPYLHSSDTAEQYDEGQIDPKGAGWTKNLTEQFDRAQRQGFKYVELDNPDAYEVADVTAAVKLANSYGLTVLAKNPLLLEGETDKLVPYVKACNGAIVERGAGSPADMDALRRKAGSPDMPVWFVAFGDGKRWAETTARQARDFKHMYVSYSERGEYGSSTDVKA